MQGRSRSIRPVMRRANAIRVTATPASVYRPLMMTRILLFFGLLLPGSTWAQAPAPASATSAPPVAAAHDGMDDVQVDRRVRKLSDELKSPYCPGKTLMTCTSYQAFELRREMKEMVRSGQTDAQIIALLNDRFDNNVSNPPQPWYTIVVPFLPYVLGALLIVIVVRRWGRKEDDEDAPAPVREDDPKLASLRARVADYSDD